MKLAIGLLLLISLPGCLQFTDRERRFGNICIENCHNADDLLAVIASANKRIKACVDLRGVGYSEVEKNTVTDELIALIVISSLNDERLAGLYQWEDDDLAHLKLKWQELAKNS